MSTIFLQIPIITDVSLLPDDVPGAAYDFPILFRTFSSFAGLSVISKPK